MEQMEQMYTNVFKWNSKQYSPALPIKYLSSFMFEKFEVSINWRFVVCIFFISSHKKET